MRMAMRGSAARSRVSYSRGGGPAAAVSRGQITSVIQLPAPVGGWNARDPLTAMAVSDAIQLDNLIAGVGGIRSRGGFASHGSGMGGPVESLMVYSPPSAAEKMFAATDTGLWDVTTPGAAVAATAGLSNGRWQHTMFGSAAGSYLFAANGADEVRVYNGTSWSVASITGTGFVSQNVVSVAVHAERLWLVENNAQHVWYLDVSSISGTATKLPLDQFCKSGGYIVAMASWTRDGGSGMDDQAVFITSNGEAIIFSGIDPSSSTTWQRVGTFTIPRPVGRRCYTQAGADLGVISSQGIVPFSSILPLAQSGAAKVAATDKISGAFSTAYNGSSTYFGWQLLEYPKERLMIVNVPIQERGTTHQYVMDTQSGSWCRFTGMNASCWAVMGDRLFFGGLDGNVYEYGSGVTADLGENINVTAISAYTDCGTPNRKMVKMVRPMITGPYGYAPSLAIRADYDLGTVNYVASPSASFGALWDEAEWDIAEWALSVVPRAEWQGVYGEGAVLSVALAAAISDQFQYSAIDLMIETGGTGV